MASDEPPLIVVAAPAVMLPPLMASAPALTCTAPEIELPAPDKFSVPDVVLLKPPAPEMTPPSVTAPAPLPPTVVTAARDRLLPITTAAALF